MMAYGTHCQHGYPLGSGQCCECHDQQTMREQRKRITELQSEVAELRANLSAAEKDADALSDRMHRINQWCEAYPLDIFPEPDWVVVKEKLGGNLLSQVSASNMRHVVTKIAEISAMQEKPSCKE